MRLKATAAAPDPRHVRWLDKWGNPTEGFTRDLLGDPAFENREAAARLASVLAPGVGQRASLAAPSAAELFNQIAFTSVDTVRSGWYQDDFPLAAALTALAEDRQNVATFRARDPEGAATSADYLEQLEADFQIVETTARALAALTGPSYRKPYPQNLGSAMTYSARPETA